MTEGPRRGRPARLKAAEVPPEGYGFAFGVLGEGHGWRAEQEERPDGSAQLVLTRSDAPVDEHGNQEPAAVLPLLFPEQDKATERSRYAHVQWHAVPEDVRAALLARMDRPKGDLRVHQVVAALVLGADLRAEPNGGQSLTVHHLDGQGLANQADNLLPMSAADHTKLHQLCAGRPTPAKRGAVEAVVRRWAGDRWKEVTKMVRWEGEGEKALPKPSKKEERGGEGDRTSSKDGRMISPPAQPAAHRPIPGARKAQLPGSSGAQVPAPLPHLNSLPPSPAAPSAQLPATFGASVAGHATALVVKALLRLGPNGGTTKQVEKAVMAVARVKARRAQELMSLAAVDVADIERAATAVVLKAWKGRHRWYWLRQNGPPGPPGGPPPVGGDQGQAPRKRSPQNGP